MEKPSRTTTSSGCSATCRADGGSSSWGSPTTTRSPWPCVAPRPSPSIPIRSGSPTCASPPPMPTSRSNVTKATSATSASHRAARSTWCSPCTRSTTSTTSARILRQVHRVLKPGAPFVLVLDHPFAAVGPTPERQDPPLRRGPAHRRRTARRPRPLQLPRRELRRARRQRRVRCPDHPRREGPQARLVIFRPHSFGDLGGGCGAEASPDLPADRSAGRSVSRSSAGR